ncbi:MAG: phosphate ABC transporter permease subunit PstC [Fimbriimonadaceae bacterium]|nr:phosphate ABC transporter permease subunit PstC [Fimbriimonadaceae bacterium]
MRRLKRRSNWGEKVLEGLVYASGGILLVVIAALSYYLVHESKYAFDRKYTFGFRFALQPTVGEYEKDIAMDPNASVITAHIEGAEGLDEKEESITMPTLEQLSGMSMFGSGTALTGDLSQISREELYRDDWRAPLKASQAQKFLLFGFATPEYKESKMVLAWEPDEGCDPSLTPHALSLQLVKGPQGAEAPPVHIDLKKQPRGRIEIPTYIAESDDARLDGYVFSVTAKPQAGGIVATLVNFFRADWGPTLAHPRYGFVPLLVGTLTITLLALLLATPISIAAAIYVSELAPSRLREWLKPVIEMLASIPTVVLGYFGLMLVAPALQKYVAPALGLESSRAVLPTAIIMAVLLIPTIMTIAEDALRIVPNGLREGAEALGLTYREKLKRVIVPAARSGIVSAVLLGFARAVGETMIVWILSGGTPRMPGFGSPKEAVGNLMQPTRGIPDTIGIEMGNVTFEGPHYGHLFLLGLTLFVLTLAINLMGFRYGRKQSWRH